MSVRTLFAHSKCSFVVERSPEKKVAKEEKVKGTVLYSKAVIQDYIVLFYG